MTDELHGDTHPSDEMSEYLQTFLDETEEQLDDLVETMLVLEEDPADQNQLNEAFRLVHSIKGSAGIMGFDSVSVLTHHLENRFERFRSGHDTLDQRTMTLVLRSIDFLRQCNGMLRQGQPLPAPTDLLEELRQLEEDSDAGTIAGSESRSERTTEAAAPDRDRSKLAPTVPANTAESGPEKNKPAAEQNSAEFHAPSNNLRIQFRKGLQLIDLKAQLIVNRLATVGNVLGTNPDLQDEARFDGLEQFDIFVATDLDEVKLAELVNVEGVESAEVVNPGTDIDAFEKTASPLLSQSEPQSESVDETQPVKDVVPDPVASELDVEPPGERQAENEIGVSSSGAVPPENPEPQTQPTRRTAKDNVTPPSSMAAKVAETMRVDIFRLDNLMNLAGELVVNRARFEQLSDQLDPELKKANIRSRLSDFQDILRRTIAKLETEKDGNRELSSHISDLRSGLDLIEDQSELWNSGRQYFQEIAEAVDQLSRVSDSLQRGVLDTRMIPVSPLFNRFKRVVRDLSRERDKDVHLVLGGEKTEMDKRLIDEMGDPLVHLVRNSIDHGLETEAERLQSGKPGTGQIVLEASHSGNNVFIQVKDDGAGIDDQKIREKLIKNGLLTETEANELTRDQALDYIWDPGFSTAKEITDISGRGVGMDVVKTRIRQLNGTVEVESIPGEGTCFTIRLPLTLAIINCLMVRLRGDIFAIPIDDVREIVSVKSSDVETVLGKQTFEVRERFLPLVDIEEIFRWGSYGHDFSVGQESARPPKNHENVVILSSAGKTIGLKVDEFLGGQDVVVKSLSDNFIAVRGLSGASILGDGSVSLMLDVSTLIHMATKAASSRTNRGGKPIEREKLGRESG